MKKILGAAVILALFLAGCKSKPQLVLYTWSEMFPLEILQGFEKETGIIIKYVNFDTNETMFSRISASGGRNYDIVIADDYIVETVILSGLAQKLDRLKLSNYGNINPLYQGQFYDAADEYTIPYGAGVQTIVYDPARTKIPIGGYTGLWHPELAGSIGIIDSFRVINGMALKVLGQSYNTNNVEIIRSAGEYLRRLAPNIRLIRDDNLQDELLSGEISVAVMYTSQVTQAKMENPNLEVVFPPEGIGFGIMAGFIPSKAPNADAAYAFLDYILDAERGARCFEFLGYYSTNAASDPLIEPEFKQFLTLPTDFSGEMEMIQNISAEAEDAHNRIWTEFKAAAGQ
ncbi:MAG: spermidine/putrescine ABC transporter substrate-binding protein [Treponema sp.]|nr:spermidine/putrescine ABC transporter substrate-binding protein [Treponema sp.]